MQRYFIEIAYRGTNYNGWQIQRKQPEKVTVQAKLHEALSTVLNKDIEVVGAGRTDSGVHATQSFAHLDMEGKLPEEFLKRVNSLLPHDIAIKQIIPVHEDAHARLDATERAYEYHIHFEKDPFLYDRSFFFPFGPLGFQKIEAATALLPTFKDFKPLSKYNKDNFTTLCEVFEARWEHQDGRLIFHIAANRFLRSMVRRIVGVLLVIGKGKITVAEFEEVMNQRGIFRINISVPPQGLYLTRVKYPYIGEK